MNLLHSVLDAELSSVKRRETVQDNAENDMIATDSDLSITMPGALSAYIYSQSILNITVSICDAESFLYTLYVEAWYDCVTQETSCVMRFAYVGLEGNGYRPRIA